MKTKIKICGLKRNMDIQYANEVMPDYIGFVFAKKSSRYVTPEQARQLRRQLKPNIISTGVFVNEDPEQVAELLLHDVIDGAQLHGQEDDHYIETLRNLLHCADQNDADAQTMEGASLPPKFILQAFRIENDQDLRRAEQSAADYILLDHGAGGTGEAFDWSLLTEMKRPFFLAGGLTPRNVGTALQKIHPYGVDVSSGVETEGYKDYKKMKEFVHAVHAI